MTAFGFKARFCQPIIDGTKGGTIRAPRKDGHVPKPGGMLQFYTGPRMKPKKFTPDKACLGVRWIRLNFGGTADPMDTPYVSMKERNAGLDLGWALQHPAHLDAFARFDGFQDWAELREFWREEHGPGTMFEGNHIRWSDWPKVLAT